ncbi:MAG: hypothetical protein H6Q60_1568 [Oscillospiraceae bacterium]|nr:hypothetical protein [Oscillospiraceae bacterium]
MPSKRKSMTTADKLQKILNDPYLFISLFMKIVDKNGNTVPFKTNKQQATLLSDMAFD